MDTAVEIDSMVTSFRRRADASILSDMDSGDSRAPRRRLLEKVSVCFVMISVKDLYSVHITNYL